MSKYRILIVDDDEDARRILLMALRPRYEVVEACDGLDALTRLEAYEPDLAIIDIMMPTMDGYQLCQAIRKHPRYSSIPVLFLSAYGTSENAKKSYAVGGNLFLTKPVDPDRVLKNIDFTVEHERPPLRTKRFPVEQLDSLGIDEIQALLKPKPIPVAAPAAPPPPQAAHPRPAPPSPPPPPPEAAGPKPRPRMLVVDDDPETRMMIDLTLRDQYEVVKAANGIEAIERMVDLEPDLLLMDIMMPRMNGYQLLQSIRRNPYFQRMPVVVLSAKTARRDREYAAKLGATDYLGKPYHVDDLLATLRRIVTAPGFVVRHKRLPIEQIPDESGLPMSGAPAGEDRAAAQAGDNHDPFARGLD